VFGSIAISHPHACR